MIRLARVDEAAALSSLALRSKASWGYSGALVEAFRRELTLRPDALDHVFVSEVDGETVGFYSLEALSAERVELGHLFVEPKAQRKGHGRALIRDAMARARAHGYRVLVIQGDPHATAFYVRMGAVVVGQRPSDSVPGRMLPLFEVDLGG